MILEVFPEPIYQAKVGLTEQELSYFKSARLDGDYRNTYGNSTSNDNFVLDNPDLSALRSNINEHLNNYLQYVIGASDVSLQITQSWLNYTNPGQFHHKHTHPNSILSGVFYMKTDPVYDKVVFFEERYEQIQILPKQYNM